MPINLFALLPLKPLSDETVYQCNELLHTLSTEFENYYYAQLKRYADERQSLEEELAKWQTSHHKKIVEPDPPTEEELF